MQCPKCGSKKCYINLQINENTLRYEQNFCCQDCGYAQPIDNEIPEQPVEVAKGIEEVTREIKLRTGKGFKALPQDDSCNEKGRMCIQIDNDPICLGFSFDDFDKTHFDVKPCRKSKNNEKKVEK